MALFLKSFFEYTNSSKKKKQRGNKMGAKKHISFDCFGLKNILIGKNRSENISTYIRLFSCWYLFYVINIYLCHAVVVIIGGGIQWA